MAKGHQNWYNAAMEKMALNPQEKKELNRIFGKPFDRLSPAERKEVIELGSKDFSRRFGSTIRQLSNE